MFFNHKKHHFHGTSFRLQLHSILENINLFKVNNRNIRKRCEIYSKLTINEYDEYDVTMTSMTSSGIFIVNFEYISHPSVVSLLLTLGIYLFAEIMTII